jgi:hypothetical protein
MMSGIALAGSQGSAIQSCQDHFETGKLAYPDISAGVNRNLGRMDNIC